MPMGTGELQKSRLIATGYHANMLAPCWTRTPNRSRVKLHELWHDRTIVFVHPGALWRSLSQDGPTKCADGRAKRLRT